MRAARSHNRAREPVLSATWLSVSWQREFHSVLNRAHSVFQERIIGNPEKSQGRIITRALLLSDEAKIGNKPELQIFGIAVRAGTVARCR